MKEKKKNIQKGDTLSLLSIMYNSGIKKINDKKNRSNLGKDKAYIIAEPSTRDKLIILTLFLQFEISSSPSFPV